MPIPTPTSRSFRYSFAQAASPGSTRRSNVISFLATPPAEVIVTTITTDGCSRSTSTWRTEAVSRPGAETSASSLVTWLSISVVDWSASSTSLRIEVRSRGKRGGRGSWRSSTPSA